MSALEGDELEPCEVEGCTCTASYFVGVERVLDAMTAEDGAIFLCGMHYALHVGTAFAACEAPGAVDPDDVNAEGAFIVDVSAAHVHDPIEAGRWALCADHGANLWELIGNT